MRAISLWQPWAELVRRRLKRYETRGWKIDYRGPLAIHAAKQKYKPEIHAQEFRTEMLFDGVDAFTLEYGAILCVVDVVDCQPTEDIRSGLSLKELMYGNYEDGRFAWKLDNVRSFEKPIVFPGKQGIFHWPGDSLLHLAKFVPTPITERIESRVEA